MNKPTFIPSIIYKDIIDDICKPLKNIENAKYYVLYIIFNNKSKYVISNTPQDFLDFYWNEKFYHYDQSEKEETISGVNYYLCKDKLGADPLFKTVLESKFNMFRTYYTIRRSPECTFVMGVLHDKEVENPEVIYKSSIKKVEDFTIDFITRTTGIIKEYNPDYARSMILNDKYYVRDIIQGKLQPVEKLTKREIECLYWIAQGKSSEEMASILNTRKSTIDVFRRNLKEKMNCSNMAHCVYEGIKRGHIGAFNLRGG